MWLVCTVLLMAGLAAARPATPDRGCTVGNATYPADVFECYAGWECYEEIYGGARHLDVHVCAQRSGGEEYGVPCFKAGSKMLTFNLKNEETVAEILERYGSPALNDEMIRCYLTVVNACEIGSGTWLAHSGRCPSVQDAECSIRGQSKFHIAMLSISLIVGISAVVVLFFCTRVSGTGALPHCRNLIIALVFRTLFTLLIETEVVSEIVELSARLRCQQERDADAFTIPETLKDSLVSWAGCEALVTFETILLNVVVAFWLVLAFYLLEFSKSAFETEPNIRRGIYLVFGLALALPVIWIIVMASGDYGNCWLNRTPVRWLNDSLRVCYIILQIIIMSLVTYRVLTEFRPARTHQALLQGRIAIYTLVLSPLFVLQFSLSASHPDRREGEDAHIYAEYFFDGLQCALVSVPYLFLPQVGEFITDVLGLRSKHCHRVFETLPFPNPELKLPDNILQPSKQEAVKKDDDLEAKTDITYTSVLSPERFERTINLYNRLNVIPQRVLNEDVPRNDPDNSSIRSVYYDVENDSVHTVYGEVIQSPVPRVEPEKESPRHKPYESKYLVEDTSDTSGSDMSICIVKSGTEITTEREEEAIILPGQTWDTKQATEQWVSDNRGEFRKTPEEETAVKTKLHRSLSGYFPRSPKAEVTGGTNFPQLNKRARKNSAPPRLGAVEPAVESKEQKGLPNIYDDLKKYQTRPKPVLPKKKPDYSITWLSYRNRLLDQRRTTRSMEGIEMPNTQEELSPQLNALLSPRYDNEKCHPGSLQSSHFSRFAMENLDKVDGESESEADRKRRKLEDGEPQKTFFIAEQ